MGVEAAVEIENTGPVVCIYTYNRFTDTMATLVSLTLWQSAIVLEGGKTQRFDDVERSLDVMEELAGRGVSAVYFSFLETELGPVLMYSDGLAGDTISLGDLDLEQGGFCKAIATVDEQKFLISIGNDLLNCLSAVMERVREILTKKSDDLASYMN